MFLYLSKLLPLVIYPLGLSCLFLILALLIRRRRRWQTALIALSLSLLWLGGNRLLTMSILRSLEWRFLPPSQISQADAIVVLGGATQPRSFPRPSYEFNDAADRLFYAAQLYRQGVASHILVTGGNPVIGPGSVPEAEIMAEALIELGVPEDAVWLEGNSRNTYENAMESSRILERQGAERVVLVTSARHMPRSYLIFSRLDLTLVPAPTDYIVTEADWNYYTRPNIGVQLYNLLPSAQDLHWTSEAMKEYIGIVIYRMRGWL